MTNAETRVRECYPDARLEAFSLHGLTYRRVLADGSETAKTLALTPRSEAFAWEAARMHLGITTGAK